MTDIKKLTEDLEYARYHCTSNKGKDAINDAIDLINRQQAENDNLEKQFRILDVECSRLEKKTEEQQAEIERLKKQDVTAEKIIREQGGTILTLKDENSRLFDRNCELSEKGEKAVIACIAARNEAIKEFAERLKDDMVPNIDDSYIESFVEEYIDNLVKEKVGEE